jgi:hypothetical protein
MLGNTCVPQQGEAALRFLLLGEGEGPARLAAGATPSGAMALRVTPSEAKGSASPPWCALWEASKPWFGSRCDLPSAGPGSVPRVPPMIRRAASDLCPTLVANDRQGGNLAGRMPDGSYRSMTLARWVRHMPERGTWGRPDTEAHPIRRGIIMRVPWACWLMGFPTDWLDLPLPCDG